MSTITSLTAETCSVQIENGELISFLSDGKEYVHQKGNPGWRKSDDEMFPVIGPTEKNNFIVHTKRGDGVQDQHGLLRELNYEQVQVSNKKSIYKKTYQAESLIKNSKFPDKSSQEFLHWPFDFEFYKSFTLSENELQIRFTIFSDQGMPFMLGYHPAFLLSGDEHEIIQSGSNSINLQQVYEVGSNAFPVLDINTIRLKHNDKKDVVLETKGFDNFMLWTEVPNMICIEPISQYTSYTDQIFSEKNMQISSGKEVFTCTIKLADE
ncbi:MAG: aldose epimerase [Flavobacteriaceae bacterium]|nr:aldose epimerase [Flavobacteriaceae bacterium]|tara:strand:- start:347518 stop:348315 length:798 start_codon:yes stop_codon:yes gene_type:complete